VHPETRIHTEHGLMRICDINRPMRVLSWNQKSQKFQLSLSGGSFPKGRGSLYRISTAHGEFQSSEHHLVLLSTGEYSRVDSLRVGDEISLAQSCPEQTIEESCLKLSVSDVQRYSQTIVNYMGDYADACRQYDPLPQEAGDYALFSEQQSAYAQECDHFCLPSQYDFLGISQKHSHPYLYGDLPCMSRSYSQAMTMECDEVNYTEASSFGHTFDFRQELMQYHLMSEPHHTMGLSAKTFYERLDFLGDSCKPPTVNDSPILSSPSPILSIDRCERSEYWCMQVLNTNNYVSEDGAIHHNSGKSHIVARKILYRILKELDCKHNFLIIRKVDRTIKRSVFTLMCNIISRWGLSKEFNYNLTDKTITYKATGSQIMFSGLDDVEKLKSIEGVTSIWCEEATELNQEDFEQLDLRLRGESKYIKQIMLTLNPISEQHWIKRIFFDDPIDGVFTLKTTYLDNAFIDDEYKMVMENKRKTNPRYYNIYALGNWGTADGLIFNNYKSRLIHESETEGLELCQGLDFGYTNDPSAFNRTYIDIKNKRLLVYDGFYETGLSNLQIADKIKEMQAHKRATTADSSEPKSIDYIRGKQVVIRPAMKGAGSVMTGIDFLLEFEIIVNAHLVEFMTEFNNYCWAVSKDGKQLNKPVDDFNHFIDSLRYAVEHHTKSNGFIFA